MYPRGIRTAVFVAAAASACASSPQTPPAPTGSADVRTAEVLASAKRWTAALNPTQGRTGAAVTTTRQKAYGTVELRVAPNRPTVSNVLLNVSVPVEPGLTHLGWAIHQGNCGSGNPPVMAPGAFPMIVLGVNGRGSVDNDIPFTLPDFGNYHVNVFRGSGTQLNDVITCGNLRRQG